MTAREKLHRAVDDLPETELEGALAFVVSRATDAPLPEDRTEIVVSDEGMEQFLDALDHPERFEDGLRRLMARAGGQAVEPR